MLLNPADKKPKDFSFLDIGQYGSVVEKESYESFSALLDDFYKKRDAAERMRQKSQDIQKTVANALSRAAKKLNAQQLELKEAKGRERLKLFGDLVMANLYRLSKGEKSLEAENYYEDPPAPVAIPLDERLTPAQNAQKYYKDYARAKNKEKYLTEQIRAGQEEIAYLETIFESLGRAENERELNEIRQELAQNGSVAPKKAQREKGKKQKQNEPTQPMKFVSDDGFTILVGKNNLQNDRLTLKTAAKQDLWLHTKNIPGSHTVIFSQGKAIPPQTVTQAAVLAATYSKAKNSHQVPVDYTVIKNVKKPSGAKPGMVIYDHYETAVVSPDEGLAERLRAK
jgi:predicted ribosome quality control (RQC) complex YloA/Tae2 family protein